MNRPILSLVWVFGWAFGWTILFEATSSKLAAAAEFTFSVPELAGNYLSSAGEPLNQNLRQGNVDLGMRLSEIQSASLRLSGSLTYGVYGNLNFPGEFPLTADITSWVNDDSGTGIAYFEEILSSDGTFDITLPYGRYQQPADMADFSSWLDGYAELQFQVSPPIMIATTYIMAMPELTIHSATLLITGQQEIDFLSPDADFNSDGDVDVHDLNIWQAAQGTSSMADADLDNDSDGTDFLLWQSNVGESTSAQQEITIPEPSSLAAALLACACLLCGPMVKVSS